jgi:hypothetical protein
LSSGKGKISGNILFESMNLGMFDRFCPSMKDREQLEEIVDLNKYDRNRERYVILMRRKKIGLISGCRNLEIIFAYFRSIIVIPVHSTGEVGDHLKERED